MLDWRLIADECGEQLCRSTRCGLTDWRARGVGRTGRIGADHAGLVRIESTLARGARTDGISGDAIAQHVSAGVSGSRGIGEKIAALGAAGEN